MSEPREIVWNRQPYESQIVALVIRDSDRRRGAFDVAWDDGRPFLIGIRTLVVGVDSAALDAWRGLATFLRREIRDERAAPDVFAQADANNARKAMVARLEAERRRREAARDNQPLPVGSLFDEVTRAQAELDL
jgi:hypothetical protein